MSDEDDDDGCCSSIESLPSEVLELILRLVSPYGDLKNCRLVCREWHKLVKDVVRWRRTGFERDVGTMNVGWFHDQPASSGPTIVARYGHGCCRHANSMFVFGGCTGRNTTFNDLWRFDLHSRRWIRPLAVGTYPPPMAFSTFVSYEGLLVLFGGLSYPSPSVLHQFQNYRLYNSLHFYDVQANQWSERTTMWGPPNIAGHSASVHGHLMVVFGGRQFASGRSVGKSNDVWVLNLKKIKWWKQTTNEPQPPPMVNQTQVAIDEDHLLIIDGCGGPNMILSDIWLLRLEREPNMPWSWTKMAVLNQQHAPANLWYHPACKVEDKLVFLGRGPRSMSPVSTPMNQVIHISPRVWIPPHEQYVPLLRVVDNEHHIDRTQNGARPEEKKRADMEPCVNGKRGVLPNRNNLWRRFSDDSLRTSTSLSPKVPDAVASSSTCGTSKEKAENSEDFRELRSIELITCPSCGSPKLHSLKRRKMSSSNAVSDDEYPAYDPALKTDWCYCPTTASSSGGPSTSSSHNVSGLSDPSVASSASVSSASVVRNSAMPSVRPNSLKNRTRQLESFQRMEQRIRNMMRPAEVPTRSIPSPPPLNIVGPFGPQPIEENGEHRPVSHQEQRKIASSARQPMFVHVLDISDAIERGVIEWLPLRDQSTFDGPEDTAFYSLVKGRGEIIMFGGIQKDHQLKTNDDTFSGRNTVSNHVYILSSKHKF